MIRVPTNTGNNRKIGEKRGHNPNYTTGYTPDKKEQRNNQRNNPNLKPLQLFYNSEITSQKNSQITSQSISQSTPQNISYTTPQKNKSGRPSTEKLLLSPVKEKNIKSIENNLEKNSILLRSPKKENIKVLTLKDLIFNLIKGPGSTLINGEKTFTNLNNVNTLLNNYERPKANIQQILSTPYKLTLSELGSLKKTRIGSGAHSIIYRLKNKGVVFKKFQETGIKKYLLPELYGGLINAKIQQSLRLEQQRYINKILQMYAYTYMDTDNGRQKNTLIVYLEESEGDMITFTENYQRLNINQACDFFDKFRKATLNMLLILRTNGLVHRDIKPDNILYKIKNGEINFELADFSTCVPNGTLVDACIGTDAYIGNEFAARFYTNRNRKAVIGYSSDLSAMGLTLLNMYIVSVYKKGVKFYNDITGDYTEVSQYFPFTNDASTIDSKVENWNDRVKYNNQVLLLETFLGNSLNDILRRPGLTDLERDNLRRDVKMIEILLLSNDPFVYRIDSTYQEIERYLGIV